MSDETGFLTETDRAFLRGEKEYDGENARQQRYQRRQAIAARTRQAFHDFALLEEALGRHERDRIFNPPEEDVDELLLALQDTVAFLYRSLEGDVGSDSIQERSFSYNFNSVFEPGVKKGEADRYADGARLTARGFVDYEPFSVQLKQNPPAVPRERVVEALAKDGGESLSAGELQAAIWHAALETKADEPADLPDDYERFDLHTLADAVSERISESGEHTSDE